MKKWAPSVDTVLWNNFFVVTRPAHYITITTSNVSLSPPTVSWMRWIIDLCGIIYATMRPYVNVLPLGTLPLGMKKMVFPLLAWVFLHPGTLWIAHWKIPWHMSLPLVPTAMVFITATFQWWDWYLNWPRNGYMPRVLQGCVRQGYICRQFIPYWDDVYDDIAVYPLLLASVVLILSPSVMAKLWVQVISPLVMAQWWGQAMAPLVLVQ